jgi:four helix bundle protein
MSRTSGNSKLENRNSPDATSQSRIRDFKDLEVWKAGRDLPKKIYELSKALPDFEKFGLASQLRRAASSVTANIAEGFGRFGYQENIQMCRQARGSLYEIRDHLTACVDEGYVTLAAGKTLDVLAQRVTQLLNGYLRATITLKKREIE